MNLGSVAIDDGDQILVSDLMCQCIRIVLYGVRPSVFAEFVGFVAAVFQSFSKICGADQNQDFAG